MGGVQSLYIPSNNDSCDCDGCCSGFSEDKEQENKDRCVKLHNSFLTHNKTSTKVSIPISYSDLCTQNKIAFSLDILLSEAITQLYRMYLPFTYNDT